MHISDVKIRIRMFRWAGPSLIAEYIYFSDEVNLCKYVNNNNDNKLWYRYQIEIRISSEDHVLGSYGYS